MQRVCFPSRCEPDRIDGVRRAPRRRVAGHAPGPRTRPAGTTTRSSSATTACSSATSRRPTSTPPGRGMAATDVNARWQAEMAAFFEDLDVPPDQGFLQLSEVFHLEDQLARHPPNSRHEGPVMTSVHRHHRPPRGAGHRGPVVGLRQLRHPLQGVRQPRDAPHRAGEDRRRRDRAPVHRPRADRGPAHPVGPGRRLTPPCGATPRSTASGSGRSTPTRSRTTTTSSAASPTPTRRSGARRSSTTSTASR